MTPIVLVHGGGFDSRCWDALLPHLGGPALAVDLPGRGRHPAPRESVSLASCADSVVSDIDAAGFDRVVLVGHSLAGCSMPFVAARLGARLAHAVFVACTLPGEGESAFDTLDPEVQELIVAAGPAAHGVMDGDVAKLVLGDDLDDDQLTWCVERLVPEAIGLTTEPVARAALATTPCTWVRTTKDLIVAPDKQLRFASTLGDCEVVDLDAGHMCMVSRPAEVARVLNDLAETPERPVRRIS